MLTTIDLDRLAALAFDLESGHPIEAVLRAHKIPGSYSAYDVVTSQQRNRRFLASAVSEPYEGIGAVH